MSNVIVSPYMSLPVPIVGQETGPEYATDIDSCLNIIDQHNHSPGSGQQINPSGLNINADLSLNSNNLTLINALELKNLSMPLTGASPYLTSLYASGGELYYNDASGNQVKITASGSVNATSSGISSGTASASFSAGVLVVKSSSTSGANILMQSAVLTNSGNLTNQLTLSAPTLSSSYGLTLPSIPGVNSVLTIDTSGNFGSSQYVANYIQNQSVTEAMLAPKPSGTSAGNVSSSSAINATFVISSTTATSPVAITGASVTLTTTGRPVIVAFMPIQQSTTAGSLLQSSITAGAPGSGNTGDSRFAIQLVRDSTNYIAGINNGQTVITSSSQILNPSTVLYQLDNVSAGTHTWTVNAYTGSTNCQLVFANVVLMAYEL